MGMLSQSSRSYQKSNWYKDNPKWEKVRTQALRRDNYMDKVLYRFGKFKQAEVVHHIFPRETYPQYQYELWNLISVTRATHNQLHDRDSHELSLKGIELLHRTCRKYHIEIPEELKEIRKKNFKKEKSWRYY